MKRTITASLLLLAISAHADGPTAIQGTNELGEKFWLHEQYFDFGPNNSPRYPLFYWDIKLTKGATEQVFEKEFCGIPDLHGRGLHFKCDSDGKSPLAGTTYVKQKELTKCRGTLYVCKAGCGPRVPLVLVKDPWECHTLGEYMDACAPKNSEKVGMTNTNGVNLRDQPDITAQVLSRLAENTRVRILERRESCLVIDYEKGQWIRVEVPDGNSVKVGWVFDAYIEYPPYFQP